MLGFGAAPVFGGAPFQGFDDILRNVADKELCHLNLPRYRLIALPW